MAATAVETGVKDHIGRLRPHTEWILANMPSPPIAKLLRKYLPQIHGGTPIFSNWDSLKPLWNACVKLAEDRNTTAHSGCAVDDAVLRTHIRTAADILYVLDALAGHEWARERVSPNLRAALGWPDPLVWGIELQPVSSDWEIDSAG